MTRLAILLLVLSAASPCLAAPVSREIFQGRQGFAAPLPVDQFTPGADAKAPARDLAGHLTVSLVGEAAGYRVLRDDYGKAKAARTLPPLDIDLVADGSLLIPARRGPARSDHAEWEWIVQPGQAWSEPAEAGAVRAVLPIALMERNANCVHNGYIALLVEPGAPLSAILQIGAETCRYFQFDMWTPLRAELAPALADAGAGVREAYRRERGVRLPVRDIRRLSKDHPGVDASAFAEAAGRGAVWGVMVDGVHYAGGCPTRQGEDPYCDVRVLPSYSLAKSIFAAVALMRLERLHPGAQAVEISKAVPECRGDGSWDGVSLLNALDMSTGHYLSPAYFADEDAAGIAPFFDAETHAGRITFACGAYPKHAAPGVRWVYHTPDTYLLGAAMTKLWRDERGPQADVFDDLVRPIYRPLALSPLLETTRRSRDAERQPFTGWGLIIERDDILRLARFLSGPEASATLDGRLLDEAMQRAGVPAADSPLPGIRYKHGFWAREVGEMNGCKAQVWAPFMSGYGGISVVLFPNGVVYYAFGDADVYDWRAAALQAHRVRSLCP